ncbi:hypothetical protein [Achromobacter insolitus]|uniref:hypothetical protein n=1 Tax=Achromobacter insolitus TaxID=217204 RepID=UPI003B9CC6FB
MISSTGGVAPPVCAAAPRSSKRHFPENPKPSDHVLFLHGNGLEEQRYVGLRRLSDSPNKTEVKATQSRKICVQKLLSWVDQLEGEDSVYLTQADFFWGKAKDTNRFRTTNSYLNSIGTVFVDLDVYASAAWSDKPISEVADAVLRKCATAGVPLPVLISSGRGLYADWALSERLDVKDASNVARWKSTQNKLMGLLQEFGADAKVSDITRVLRLVGTHNAKAGAPVQIVSDDGLRHSVEALEKAVEGLPVFVTRAPKSKGVGPGPGQSPRLPVRTKRSIAPKTTAPLATEEALTGLKAMIASDQHLYANLSALRQRHYRIFADIASVILSRGGLAEGTRDEFIFWLLVSRFNAGLYTVDQLSVLSAQFAGLAQGGLDLWQAGMLTTLHARMAQQAAEQGEFRASAIIRKVGPFTACAYVDRNACAPKVRTGYGQGYQRARVYTPSVATLITKLGISSHEQASLTILIGADEKRRRRSITGPRAARVARNQRLRECAVTARSLGALAAEFSVSRSTVYRAVGTTNTRAVARREGLELAVVNAYKFDSTQPIRAIANQVGVPLSTAFRWIKAHRQRVALQLKKEAERRRSEVLSTVLDCRPFAEALSLRPMAALPGYGTTNPYRLSVPMSQDSFASSVGIPTGGEAKECRASFSDVYSLPKQALDRRSSGVTPFGFAIEEEDPWILAALDSRSDRDNPFFGLNGEGAHTESLSGGVDEAGTDALSMTLGAVKEMTLASIDHKAWTPAEKTQFRVLVSSCEEAWPQSKFQAQIAKSLLVGNKEMRSVLQTFYALAKDMSAQFRALHS